MQEGKRKKREMKIKVIICIHKTNIPPLGKLELHDQSTYLILKCLMTLACYIVLIDMYFSRFGFIIYKIFIVKKIVSVDIYLGIPQKLW